MVAGKARESTTLEQMVIENRSEINLLKALIRDKEGFSSSESRSIGLAGGNTAQGIDGFLKTSGDTMIGPIAYLVQLLAVDTEDGSLDVSRDKADAFTSRIIVSNTTAKDIDYIHGAAYDGQQLEIQGVQTETNLLRESIQFAITNIVGSGTVTVTIADTSALATGDYVKIGGTTNFDIDHISIIVTGGTTFTYLAPGSGIPESSGFALRGNIRSHDGNGTTIEDNQNFLFAFDVGNNEWVIIGGAGGDASLWSTFDAIEDIDYATFDGINIDRLSFTVDSGVPRSAGDPSIFLNAGGDMTFNVPTGDNFFWEFQDDERMTLQESGVNPDIILRLKAIDDGTPILRISRHDSTPSAGASVGRIEFEGEDSSGATEELFARITVDAEDLTIGSVDGSMHLDAYLNSLPVTFLSLNNSNDGLISIWKNMEFQTGIDLEMNGNDIKLDAVGDSLIFADGAGIKINATGAGDNVLIEEGDGDTFNFNNAGLALGSTNNLDLFTHAVFITPSTSTLLVDGAISYHSTDNEFKFRENGITKTLAAGGANNALSNLAAVAINTNLISDTDGLDDLGSPSFWWDEVFGRTIIFKDDKPVESTETAIGSDSSELWLNQTTPANLIAFRWDNVVSYEFGRTIFKTQNPILSWQMVNGVTNTLSITDLGNATAFDQNNYEHFIFEGNNHTRLELVGIGFTTPGLNDDEILFDSSNSTASDIVGQIHYVGHTDTAANFDIAKIVALNEVPTNATRSGLLEFRLSQSGTENDLFIDLSGFFNVINFRKELDMHNNIISDIGEGTITNLTTVTAAGGDLVMIVDNTDGLMKKVDITDFLGGGGANVALSNLASVAINVSLLPNADGTLNNGSATFAWNDVFQERVRIETGGSTTTSANQIIADAGGMIFNVPSGDRYEFNIAGSALGISIDDGEIQFLESGRQHKIVAQATAIQIIAENAGDSVELWNGASRSNPTVDVNDTQTRFQTSTTQTNLYTLSLMQNNNTPADFRTLANIDFMAEDSGSTDTVYARISASSQDITNATEDGLLQLGVVSGGTLVSGIDIEGSSSSGANDAMIGFFGESPVVQQTLAASPTAAQISAVLEALGLTKFS